MISERDKEAAVMHHNMHHGDCWEKMWFVTFMFAMIIIFAEVKGMFVGRARGTEKGEAQVHYSLKHAKPDDEQRHVFGFS